MPSVLHVRTYLSRLKGSQPHRDRPAPRPAPAGTAHPEGAEPRGARDDSLARWEVDGGRLHAEG
jgi:hypothetical protein